MDKKNKTVKEICTYVYEFLIDINIEETLENLINNFTEKGDLEVADEYSQVWQIGVILFVPIIYLYNGKPGNKSTFNKWFFYLFYPLHLVVIGIIRSRL